MRIHFILLITVCLLQACKQESTKVEIAEETFHSDTSRVGVKWFPEAKLGIFVHWLLPDANKEKTDSMSLNESARKSASLFTASKYNPKEWAKLFKNTGAKYVVLTTKHHIGFSLFDCEGHKFSATKASPAGRDLLIEYVEALRAEGIRVGFYFSLPDWTNPNYASIKCPEGKKDCKERAYSNETDTVKWNLFVKQMFKEVRHLCSAYGKVDLFWFDGDWERSAEQWKSIKLAKMIDSLQPDAVINNRLRHKNLGHYGTPEQIVPLQDRGDWWELCITPGDGWGKAGANTNIKPVSYLVRTFCDVIGMGGNMLLNVAPDADGTIPKNQLDTLERFGKWVNENSEAIFSSKAALAAGYFNGAVTRKGSVLYLFSYDIPTNYLVLKGTNSIPKRITQLNKSKTLEWKYIGGYSDWDKGWLHIKPSNEWNKSYTMVTKLEFEGDSVSFRTIASKSQKFSYYGR